jgi:hypothetical protein
MARIDEITRPHSAQYAEMLLQQKGYVPLGRGTMATVWGKPGVNTVLKIFREEDKAYLDFARLAMQHRENAHFPRFNGKLIRVCDGWRAIRMERLTPLKLKHNKIGWAIDTFLTFGSREAVEKFAETGSIRVESVPKMWDRVVELFDEFPNMKPALNIIRYNLGQHRWDAHSQNIMLRNDRIPVLTDPVW